MNENKIKKAIEDLESLNKVNYNLFGCVEGYSPIKSILEDALTVFKFAKFNINDRVELIITPDIDKNIRWGWLGFKHFLIKGAVATVIDREFYKGQFVYTVLFDDDSYIEFHTGKKILTQPDKRGCFTINEDWLSKHDEQSK